jgi:hypothetical protein
MSSVAEE